MTTASTSIRQFASLLDQVDVVTPEILDALGRITDLRDAVQAMVDRGAPRSDIQAFLSEHLEEVS